MSTASAMLAKIRTNDVDLTREEFVAAVHAEDRLLTSGFYMVPFFDAGGQWVARWNTIGLPEAQPLPGFEATTLWRNK